MKAVNDQNLKKKIVSKMTLGQYLKKRIHSDFCHKSPVTFTTLHEVLTNKY